MIAPTWLEYPTNLTAALIFALKTVALLFSLYCISAGTSTSSIAIYPNPLVSLSSSHQCTTAICG